MHKYVHILRSVYIYIAKSLCICSSKAWWSVQLLPLAPSPSPPISHPPPPFTTPSLCFLVLKCLNQLHFLTSHVSLPLYSWLYAFFSSLCSPDLCDNSLTFAGLLPAHFFLWARHPLQVALSPLNISNTWCPLHLQHCFLSTCSTTIELHFPEMRSIFEGYVAKCCQTILLGEGENVATIIPPNVCVYMISVYYILTQPNDTMK